MLRPPGEDEDNIMTALKQSDRVRSISLTVASSLQEKLSTISEPFFLMSRDNMRRTLPGAFQ